MFDGRLADGSSEVLEPEKIKGGPLCMASYKYLYVRSPNPDELES